MSLASARVSTLLSPEEFVARAMAMPGIPWVRWRADWRACDCFGLIVLWFREVLGIDLGEVPHTDIAAGFERAKGWVQCGPEAGASAWMAWRGGVPTHCGIVLSGCRLLHCEGSESHPGNVRVSRLAAMERLYGEIRFYRYQPC